jgi:hypothetical protein
LFDILLFKMLSAKIYPNSTTDHGQQSTDALQLGSCSNDGLLIAWLQSPYIQQEELLFHPAYNGWHIFSKMSLQTGR